MKKNIIKISILSLISTSFLFCEGYTLSNGVTYNNPGINNEIQGILSSENISPVSKQIIKDKLSVGNKSPNGFSNQQQMFPNNNQQSGNVNVIPSNLLNNNTPTIDGNAIGGNKYNSFSTNNNFGNMKTPRTSNELYFYNKGFEEGYKIGKEITEETFLAKLQRMEKYMDQIFNFQRLYIENKIEPPKVVVIKTPVEVTENGKQMIIEQEQIQIIEPAKLLAKPKTWKTFLIED